MHGIINSCTLSGAKVISSIHACSIYSMHELAHELMKRNISVPCMIQKGEMMHGTCMEWWIHGEHVFCMIHAWIYHSVCAHVQFTINPMDMELLTDVQTYCPHTTCSVIMTNTHSIHKNMPCCVLVVL